MLVAGPEHPTLAERLVSLFHLPYIVGCGLLSFAVFGPPLYILVSYSISLDSARAVAEGLRPMSGPELLSLVLGAYIFYIPRSMRRRILHAEESLSPLLPNGEEDFHRLFERVAALKPQIVMWILFFLIGTISFLAVKCTPVRSDCLVESIAIMTFFSLGATSVVWTYASSLLGLHRMGSVPMEFRPFHEDPSLGLRAVGSLALSLARAYFIGIGLTLILFIGSIPLSSTIVPVSTYGILAGLILLGVLLFFLPLVKLHQRMLDRKRLERDRLKDLLGRVFHNSEKPSDLGNIMVLDMMDRKVSSIAVWPFDLNILGRLSIIVFSVIATLISTAIIRLLG